MISIYSGYLDIATLLIEKGANKYAQDINGLNIIHYAVDSDQILNVRFCLDVIQEVDQKDNNGWTPLLRAGKSKEFNTMKGIHVVFLFQL